MESINLQGLKETDIQFLKDLADFLRARAQEEEKPRGKAEEIVYHSWPLGVGPVTREEIYDYL